MKVTFLLAQCTPHYLQDSVTAIMNVLKELDIEIDVAELHQLPYFSGKKTKQMDRVVEMIHSSRGVVAATCVPMLSMHGAMQSFFDCATVYEAELFNKPILAVTYSEWLGEVEAAERILKNWGIIGGAEGYKIGINKNTDFSVILPRLERLAEDFYRFIKQDRQTIPSTERQLFTLLKTGQPLAKLSVPMQEVNKAHDQTVNNQEIKIKSFADIIRQDQKIEKSPEILDEPHINLSTKEQTIKEIAHLLKKQVNTEEKEEEPEPFTAMNSGIYKKPSGNMLTPGIKRLQQMPHYFVAKHDKSLELILKYVITNSNDEGFIIIKDGDCEFAEITKEPPAVELILTEEVFTDILTKKVTYQKAFMLGKLKVKGNFAILPKLDQIFTSI